MSKVLARTECLKFKLKSMALPDPSQTYPQYICTCRSILPSHRRDFGVLERAHKLNRGINGVTGSWPKRNTNGALSWAS